MKKYKIVVSSRVDLWLCDVGFRFTNSDKTPIDFQPFSSWDGAWQPYKQYQIENKIAELFDTFPEHLKIKPLFQNIKFS